MLQLIVHGIDDPVGQRHPRALGANDAALVTANAKQRQARVVTPVDELLQLVFSPQLLPEGLVICR